MKRKFAPAAVMLALIATPVSAQFDPRPSLNSILTAFQMCGPRAAYQALSPSLFQIVAQQTGGSGCYLPIAQAGPILGMQVLDTRMFPVGPMYAVRVTHAAGPVDWFIGFNQATGSIEYLSFQTVGASAPTIDQGADPSRTIGGVTPPPQPLPSPGPKPGPKTESEACKNFPRMCP